MINTITICGGGSLGIVCAGVFLSQGKIVNLLTGHPDDWSTTITIFDSNGKIFKGDLNQISNNPIEVIPDADLVLLCLPGFLIEEMLYRIKPFLNKNTVLGSIVSSTGFFFEAHKIIENQNPIFGFQRVPFIARQKEYGRQGNLLGYKKSLNVAIENCSHPELLREELERLFITPVNLLNNFYEASLTNSNPILHTARLYSMWGNYNGEVFDKPSKFYADWTNKDSEILLAMDEEFMALLKCLKISTEVVPPLLDYYGCTDAHTLTAKLKSIPAFQSISSPMKKVKNGWVPDLNSRYFIEDFPYGLRMIYDLAHQQSVNSQVIDSVYEWGIEMLTRRELV